MSNRGVCVVTHPLSAAGENATRTLLNILAAIGSVSLVTADLPSESSIRSEREVIELTSKGAGERLPVAAFRFLLNQLRMCLVLRKRPESVVLFFGATSYFIPILFARVSGKTVLVEPRGDVPLTLRLNWEQRLPAVVARGLAGLVGLLESGGFAAAHRVVTYTPSMARQLGLDPDSEQVYPHGARYVDIEQFSIQAPLEDRDDVVGFVGRLDEEKGIRKLAAAAKRLPDSVTFRFVGDGPLYEWLADELTEEIEAGTVELVGWVTHDDIPRELNRMKLLVLPSHPTEGLPTTILESLACGTPVYATPVSGVPDVVKDGETGFLGSSQEVEEIVRDLERALSADDDIASISARGRMLIEDEYSFGAAQARYQRLLADLA